MNIPWPALAISSMITQQTILLHEFLRGGRPSPGARLRTLVDKRLPCLPPKHIIPHMRLPIEVREQFRRYGRAGGRARAARMSTDAKKGVARRAAIARWIGERFGASSFRDLGLPGGDIVDAGLADLAEGRVSAESLAISIAMPRLKREGVPLGSIHANPEDRLYSLLSQRSGDLAHARYNAYLGQICSFANACHGIRLDRVRRAR